MPRSRFVVCARAVFAAVCLTYVTAYSEFAGSCLHADVARGHGDLEAQPGDGSFELSLEGGAEQLWQAAAEGGSVLATLQGGKKYKGLLLWVADPGGEPLGSWSGEKGKFRTGTHVHPDCQYAVTHSPEHTVSQRRKQDKFLFFPPSNLTAMRSVTFKITVVVDYATWFALERTFTAPNFESSDHTDTSLILVDQPASESSIDFASEPVREETRLLPWAPWVSMRIHGVFMVLSFMVLGPAGILVARYYRHRTMWFSLHVWLQAGAVLLAVLAYLLLLVDGPRAPSISFWHRELGLLALGLFAVQPPLGWLRPPRRQRCLRATWLAAHITFGWLGVVAGWSNVASGFRLALQRHWSRTASSAVLAAVAAALVVLLAVRLEVALRSHQLHLRSQATKSE